MLMYERQKGVGSTPVGTAEAILAQDSALFAGAAIAIGKKNSQQGREHRARRHLEQE
jgi:hypothetical protein